jgi:uncharacterized protein (UPF0335 family)
MGLIMDNARLSNGFKPEQIKGYLDEIDDADDELDRLKGEHMQRCKRPRQQIKETIREAKDAGINTRALRVVIADHRAKRKLERRVNEMEADDADDYAAMQDALGEFGDTPLGAAALDRAKARGEETLKGLS